MVDLTICLLCSGKGDEAQSYRPNLDESQWWGRRDALVRCVSASLYGPRNTKQRPDRVEPCLLFDEDGWTDLADRWDVSLWLDVPEDVLAHRLTQRWLDQGMTQQDAVARAQGNDIPNARRVLKSAKTATWSLRNWQKSSE